MNTLYPFALGAAAAVATGVAWTAEPVSKAADPIDQVVVVAHKSERPLRDIAANVTVLTADDLAPEMALSMADVLRYVPGIDVEGGGSRFGSEGVNIRGIGGNRVALLVDGVPLSDHFDVGSFSNATRDFVDAGFVQRAEVLHGPASALYGSAAIGGVVALRSPDPAQLTGTDAGDGIGGRLAATWRNADQSLHATGIHAVHRGATGVLLGLGIRDGEGFASAAVDRNLDARAYRSRSALLKVVTDDARGDTWQLGYYGQDSRVESELASMLGSGRFRSTTRLAGDDRARIDLLAGEVRFGDPSGHYGSGMVRAYAGRADIEQYTLDERGLAPRPVSIDRRFGFEQALRGFEVNLQKDWSGRRTTHRTAVGIEYRRRRTEEVRDGLETGLVDGQASNVLLGEVFPLRDFPVSDSNDWGVYAEDTMSSGSWMLTAGLRGDRYELEPANDRVYAEDYPFATPVSVSVQELSPKLGIVYRPRAQLDIYLQYAHGFRAPPYQDANIGLELPLFNYRAVPNPDLRSEESDGVELGLRSRGSRLAARLAVFRTQYDDFIESKVRIGPDPDSGRILFQSRNLNAAVIAGVEAGATLTLDYARGTLVVDVSAYVARGENRDTGEPLNSVGPAQAVVGADWLPDGGGWQLRFRATLTDDWSDRDESAGALFAPPGHAVVDLYAARPLGRRTSIRVGLTNLADRTVWNWSEVRGLAPDDPVLPYLARPGRSFAVGIEFHW